MLGSRQKGLATTSYPYILNPVQTGPVLAKELLWEKGLGLLSESNSREERPSRGPEPQSYFLPPSPNLWFTEEELPAYCRSLSPL